MTASVDTMTLFEAAALSARAGLSLLMGDRTENSEEEPTSDVLLLGEASLGFKSGEAKAEATPDVLLLGGGSLGLSDKFSPPVAKGEETPLEPFSFDRFDLDESSLLADDGEQLSWPIVGIAVFAEE